MAVSEADQQRKGACHAVYRARHPRRNARGEDLERLMKATVTGQGEDEVSKEQLDAVVSWAIGARTESAMLDLVLRGRATVRVREDGELVFALAEGAGPDKPA